MSSLGNFVDQSGVTRLRASGGGGGAPTTRETWGGNGVAINPNDFAWLTWNSSGGPDAVLDATDPAHPTVITAGVYVVSVIVRPTGDNGARYEVTLFLDRHGFNASQDARVYGDPTNSTADDASIAFAWYIPAGGAVEVSVDYQIASLVQANCSLLIASLQRVA